MTKLIPALVAGLVLAACQNGGGMVGGNSGSSLASDGGGCNAGRADFLHQDKPGGSDHSTVRCAVKGY